MDDVDSILLNTLIGIGCEFEEIDSLKELTTEQCVEAVVRCLRLIQPDISVSPSLPPSMSARYRITTILADEIKKLGYTNDVGYHTFLYSSLTDVRKIFMFLIDKLPKESSKPIIEQEKPSEQLNKSICKALSNALSSPWIPYYCLPRDSFSQFYSGRFIKTGTELSLERNQSIIEPKLGPALCCSLLEYNESSGKTEDLKFSSTSVNDGLANILKSVKHSMGSVAPVPAKRTLPTINTGPKPTPVPKPRNIKILNDKQNHVITNNSEQKLSSKKENEDRISSLRSELSLINDNINDTTVSINKTECNLTELQEKFSQEEAVITEKQESFKLLNLTCELLPSYDENFKKLEGLIESGLHRHEKLREQWRVHEEPLNDEIEKLEARLWTKQSAETDMINEIKQFRANMKEIKEEAARRDDLEQQLESQVGKLSKSVKRGVYTKRILEIINNIKKQHDELEKVLSDTKVLQKEINKLQGQLDRSFTLADELVFKDAKTDETSRRAYKQLAALHEGCDQLIQCIQDIGVIQREIQQLKDQIHTETQKNVKANLERLTQDLNKMKQENKTLEK